MDDDCLHRYYFWNNTLNSRKENVHSEIIVNAPKEKVWKVLLNTDKYEEME